MLDHAIQAETKTEAAFWVFCALAFTGISLAMFWTRFGRQLFYEIWIEPTLGQFR